MNTFLYWIPRILSLAFVGFLSLFALDVFSGPFEWGMFVGFLVHMIPMLALLILSIFAWRYPLVGAIAFIGFACMYVVLVGLDRPWSWYLGISLPSLIVGFLYLADWRRSTKTE